MIVVSSNRRKNGDKIPKYIKALRNLPFRRACLSLFMENDAKQYQISITKRFESRNALILLGFTPFRTYSHSILAGGLVVTSYSTRLHPDTSPTIRVAIRPSSS